MATQDSSPQSTGHQPRLYDKRRKGWWYADNAVIDDVIEQVPKVRRSDALAVYSVVCRHADSAGAAFPKVSYLMSKTGCSKNIVIEAIKELVKVGLISKIAEFDADRRQLANSYTVNEISGRGGSDLDPGEGGSNLGSLEENQCKEEKVGGSEARPPANPLTNPFGFFVELAQANRIEVYDTDKVRTAKNLRDLVRTKKPNEAELKKTINKMLVARDGGYDLSPQQALDEVRTSNVRRIGRDGEDPWANSREI